MPPRYIAAYVQLVKSVFGSPAALQNVLRHYAGATTLDITSAKLAVCKDGYNALVYGRPVSGELGFDDADSISAWARDAVRWCVDNGILNGVGGNRMTPQDLARRGQVAAMLMRFLQATV